MDNDQRLLHLALIGNKWFRKANYYPVPPKANRTNFNPLAPKRGMTKPLIKDRRLRESMDDIAQ